jgi:uncharacterized membrane protein
VELISGTLELVMEGYSGTVLAAVTGLVYQALGWPLMKRRIKPNHWYGYRISSTLKDERVWYPVNERGGKHLVLAGGVLLALALLGLLFIGDERLQWDLVIVTLVVSLASIAYSVIVCIQMARELERNIDLSSKTGAEPTPEQHR